MNDKSNDQAGFRLYLLDKREPMVQSHVVITDLENGILNNPYRLKQICKSPGEIDPEYRLVEEDRSPNSTDYSKMQPGTGVKATMYDPSKAFIGRKALSGTPVVTNVVGITRKDLDEIMGMYSAEREEYKVNLKSLGAIPGQPGFKSDSDYDPTTINGQLNIETEIGKPPNFNATALRYLLQNRKEQE